MAKWFYYGAGGNKTGPVDGEEIKRLATVGTISTATAIEDGQGQRTHAGNVQGLVFNTGIALLRKRLDRFFAVFLILSFLGALIVAGCSGNACYAIKAGDISGFVWAMVFFSIVTGPTVLFILYLIIMPAIDNCLNILIESRIAEQRQVALLQVLSEHHHPPV